MTVDLRKGSYVLCHIESCNKRFLATSVELYYHVLDVHGKELWDRGPNICRKFHDLIMTFYKQTN